LKLLINQIIPIKWEHTLGRDKHSRISWLGRHNQKWPNQALSGKKYFHIWIWGITTVADMNEDGRLKTQQGNWLSGTNHYTKTTTLNFDAVMNIRADYLVSQSMSMKQIIEFKVPTTQAALYIYKTWSHHNILSKYKPPITQYT
jgi:hypothetical protein